VATRGWGGGVEAGKSLTAMATAATRARAAGAKKGGRWLTRGPVATVPGGGEI
jgi:hypothetical protein